MFRGVCGYVCVRLLLFVAFGLSIILARTPFTLNILSYRIELEMSSIAIISGALGFLGDEAFTGL